MRKKKKGIRAINTLCFLSLLLVIIPAVHALGVSPGVQDIIFESGLSQTHSLKILSGGDSFTVRVYVSGDLEKYITVKEPTKEIGPQGGEIEYTVNFPPSIRPGNYNTYVVIEKMNFAKGGSGSGKANLGATAAVAHAVRVYAPAQSKYAEATLEVSDAKVGNPINFKIGVSNFGYENINDVYATIKVYNITNDSVVTLTTDHETVIKGGSVDIYAYWVPTNITPGVYLAKAVTSYDNLQRETERTFRIGDIFVDIIGIEPAQLFVGEINKLRIKLESFWSSPIKNIHGTITINGAQRSEVIKTPSIDLGPWEKSEFLFFLDATDYKIGNYNARVNLTYEDRSTAKDFLLDVVGKPPALQNRAPAAFSGQDSRDNFNLGMIITLFILVIGGVELFIIQRRKIYDKAQSQPQLKKRKR